MKRTKELGIAARYSGCCNDEGKPIFVVYEKYAPRHRNGYWLAVPNENNEYKGACSGKYTTFNAAMAGACDLERECDAYVERMRGVNA